MSSAAILFSKLWSGLRAWIYDSWPSSSCTWEDVPVLLIINVCYFVLTREQSTHKKWPYKSTSAPRFIKVFPLNSAACLQMEITRAVKGKAKKKNNRVGHKIKTIRLAVRAEGWMLNWELQHLQIATKSHKSECALTPKESSMEGGDKGCDAEASRATRWSWAEINFIQISSDASEAATNHGWGTDPPSPPLAMDVVLTFLANKRYRSEYGWEANHRRHIFLPK